MDQSGLIKLPLEIQRLIVFHALWTKQSVRDATPMDFTLLRVCRYLREITLDILRRDFKWIDCTIYRCVGSSFLSGGGLKNFQPFAKLLLSLKVIGAESAVSFEVCSCSSQRIWHSAHHFTRIVAPFEIAMFAEMCAQVTSGLAAHRAHAHFTVDMADHSPQMGLLVQTIELKLRNVYLRSSGEPTKQVRKLQTMVAATAMDSRLIMAFFKGKLVAARRALNRGQFYTVLHVFLDTAAMFQHAELVKICRDLSTVNNTTGILYSCLGLATLQAICQILVKKMRYSSRLLNEIRVDAKKAAVFHILLDAEDRWKAYLWDIAVVLLIGKTVDRYSTLHSELSMEAQKSYHYATEILPTNSLPSEMKKMFSRDIKSTLSFLAPITTVGSSDWTWKGPLDTFELWDEPKGWCIANCGRWKLRNQDIIDSIEDFPADDPLEIIMNTLK